MSDSSPWTIGRLLNWTTEFLGEKGSTSPRLDAEVLLAHARSCQRIELYTAFAEPAPDDLRERFRSLVKERAAGKPVAYLVGYREFFSLPFRVTPDVLIPRPETELLVVRALDIAKEHTSGEPLEIADIGTGSGALAVSIAKHLPNCRVTATDISPAALAVARENSQEQGVANQIDFLEGDLFATVPPEPRFHLVVSNPPYVTTAEMAALDRTVADFEPHSALAGGEQGTDVIERLLPAARDRLLPGASLLVEVSPTIAERVAGLATSIDGLSHVKTHRDLGGNDRVVEFLRKA